MNSTSPPVPRYSVTPLPPYRYLPFQGSDELPHPKRDPKGYAYGKSQPRLPGFTADNWQECDSYLYGIDLFNHGYWWESHEALEEVWKAAGYRETDCGRFLQGLIQLAAAQLKRFIGQEVGARKLTAEGLEKITRVDGVFLGIDVSVFAAEARRCLSEDRDEYPQIRLIR